MQTDERAPSGSAPFSAAHAPQKPEREKRRERTRKLIRKLRERRRVRKQARAQSRSQHADLAKTRRFKRKTAMALTASVATFNSGAFAATPLMQPVGQPVIQMELIPQTAADDRIETRAHADTLNASDTFKEALIEEEGVRLRVYRDVAGYPTVGVGHLVTRSDNLRVGQKISYDRVLRLLEKDIAIAEEGVRRLVGDLPLYQHEFDALVDLVFNVGEGNVSERKSPRLNSAIADRDYDAMAEELAYHNAGGKKARGLEFRSERRTQMFMNASYEDPRENV